jgi:putative ABC transport system permease protein
MLFELAFKNLFRNARRTLLLEISIVFGVIVIVFVGNFLHGMQRSWAQFEINSNSGAFEIEHRDYKELRKAEPLKVSFERGDAVIAQVKAQAGVKAAFGKLNFSGVVSNGNRSTAFAGTAVDVVGQRQTLPLQEDLIVAGRAISEKPGEIVLGSDLAAMLGLKIGDAVSVVVQTYHGSLNLQYGSLVGTKNGRHFPSSTYLEMSLPDAQKLLRVDDRISQIVVATNDYDAIPEVMAKTMRQLQIERSDFVARAYPELIPIYAMAIASFGTITMVVGVVLFVLVGGGLSNAMAMAVMERTREIGTVRALGMRKGQVRAMFLIEGGIVGVVGAVIGLLLVSLITLYVVSRGGVHLPPVGGTSQGLSIVPQFDLFSNVFGLLMPLVVGLLASWWPAAKSADLNPVDALRQ